jgi:hypothetical protein
VAAASAIRMRFMLVYLPGRRGFSAVGFLSGRRPR